MASVVIVGGGPAGLAAAYRLAQRWDIGSLLLERAPVLGGLAAGFRHKDYILDFGPHRLHTELAPDVLRDLQLLLGQDLVQRTRHGKIRVAGRYVPYPLGPRAALSLGIPRLAALTAGIALAKAQGNSSPAGSYEALLVRRLGRPLYDLFYGPYAEKTWGLPGSQIAVTQAERRVNQRGFSDLLRAAAGRGAPATYYYPQSGFGQIPAAYEQALEGMDGVTIERAASVQEVVWSEDQVVAVRYEARGQWQEAAAGHCIWSAPLPELVRRMTPAPPDEVREAVGNLRYRAVVLLYLALNKPNVGDADTYYFPEPQFPFNRAVEFKKFSPRMSPAGKTVLCLDIPCNPDSDIFSASDADLLQYVLPALHEAGLVAADEVEEVFSRRFSQVYPIYDLTYQESMSTVMAWMEGLRNLWLVGRQGLFLHNNTHHSLYMGYRAADAIGSETREGWDEALTEFEAFRVAD